MQNSLNGLNISIEYKKCMICKKRIPSYYSYYNYSPLCYDCYRHLADKFDNDLNKIARMQNVAGILKDEFEYNIDKEIKKMSE